MNNLQIGVSGWQVPEGQGTFYPQDMPVEWQLDYYSNAFRVVLVPESQWMAWSSEDFEACVDGSQAEFGFYLRVDESLTAVKRQQILAVLQGLGDLLRGVLLFSDDPALTVLECGVPISLLSKNPVEPIVSAVGSSLSTWRGKVGEYYVLGQPVGYCEALSSDGKQQATLLKSFMQQVPDSDLELAFFIGGESINMSHVTNLKVVAEFLGY